MPPPGKGRSSTRHVDPRRIVAGMLRKKTRVVEHDSQRPARFDTQGGRGRRRALPGPGGIRGAGSEDGPWVARTSPSQTIDRRGNLSFILSILCARWSGRAVPGPLRPSLFLPLSYPMGPPILLDMARRCAAWPAEEPARVQTNPSTSGTLEFVRVHPGRTVRSRGPLDGTQGRENRLHDEQGWSELTPGYIHSKKHPRSALAVPNQTGRLCHIRHRQTFDEDLQTMGRDHLAKQTSKLFSLQTLRLLQRSC